MTSPKDIIRPDILAMESYAVADAVGFIKLDAMENPYSLPDDMAKELGDALSKVALNRYPLPNPKALTQKLKNSLNIADDNDILFGNGSDELIHLLSMACAKPNAKVLTPVPGFVMYRIYAELNKLEFMGIELTKNFELDKEKMLNAIETHSPSLIFIAYPNNPTGALFDEKIIEQIIIKAKKSLVVIDEAYEPFAQKTWISRINDFNNLIVMRTFSKLGLAGIRLGYLVGKKEWIAELDKVRPPYNINALTLATLNFMLDKMDLLKRQAKEICDQRNKLAAEIKTLPNITTFKSDANFLLIRVKNAQKVFQFLLEQKILVKNLDQAHPLLKNCLRLTIGTPDENQKLLKTLKETLVSH